jgi:hypothetical protein
MTFVFYVILFLALAAMSATHVAREGPAAGYPGSFVRLLILLGSAAAFLVLLRYRPRWELLRDAMPFVFCANVYASLHDLIRFFGASDITASLARWDLALFGVQPTVWAEQFITPPLTDFFTVCYWLFYVCAPLLGLFLLLKRDRRGFRYTMVTIVLCLYLGYVGYFAFPAAAPRLFMPEAYSIPLKGNTILDLTRSATAAVPLTAKGAFPFAPLRRGAPRVIARMAALALVLLGAAPVRGGTGPGHRVPEASLGRRHPGGIRRRSVRDVGRAMGRGSLASPSRVRAPDEDAFDFE